MWNNLIFGFLLLATICTQCQCTGYPKIKPDNPLELPTLNYDDKINIITDSASQHASSTAQDITPEQVPSDDNTDKVISIPQVHEDTHEGGHHHHHGEDGAYNPHDDGTGWDIRKSIPGEPGRDYPTYSKVVDTSFTCGGKAAGYYADLESRCQIFRVCTTGSVNAFNSFLCPNGSLFNQAVLTCDWWPNVDCQGSSSYYHKNNGLGHIPQGQQFMDKIRQMIQAPILNPYKPVHEETNDDTPVTKTYQVRPQQNIVTITETYSTTPVTFTTPKIHLSTFETLSTTGPSIIESTQQYYTGHYDEKTQTNALVSHHGTTELISNEQVSGNSIVNHHSTESSHAHGGQLHLSETLQTLFTTTETETSVTPGPLHLSHPQTIHHSTESSHAQTGQLHLSETLQTSLPLLTTGTETDVTPGPIHLSHPQTIHESTESSHAHGGQLHLSETLQTSLPLLTTGTETDVTPGPLHLSHPKTEHIFFSTTAKLSHQTTSSENKLIGTHSDSSAKDGHQLYTSDIHPKLKLSPVVANHSAHLSNKLFLSQNAPIITLGQNNINEQGPEKITLLINDAQKQGLLHQQNLVQTNSGLNIQKETSVNTNTVKQVVGGLNINNPAQLFQSGSGANSQSETNKQTFSEINKSIELPHSREGLHTTGGNIQHYARILNNNEPSTIGAQNLGGNIQNYQDQQNQFANLFNQNTQQQDQALQNFAVQTQNIHNTGLKDFSSGIPHGVQVDVRNKGIQNDFGQNQQNFNAQNGFNLNQGFSGETQNAGLQNQGFQSNFGIQSQGIQNQGFQSNFGIQSQGLQNQGFQSNFGIQGQNPLNNFNTQNLNFNQGFSGETQNAGLQNQGFQANFGLQSQGLQNGYSGLIGQSQNQGVHNLGSLNFDQNAFINQNGFQNGGVSGSNPNFHEQNYQNFNFFSKNNAGQNANYELSKNGAAQNYKGESRSQHVNGQTHSSYSGHNYAYKESTKVEVVPSLGFTLTDDVGRASYASAVISGLVQEKRGASSANFAEQTVSPSDVRHSSYQGPSSYLVPQASVQHLPSALKQE